MPGHGCWKETIMEDKHTSIQRFDNACDRQKVIDTRNKKAGGWKMYIKSVSRWNGQSNVVVTPGKHV